MMFVVVAVGHVLVMERWSICALFAEHIALNGYKPMVRRATAQEAEGYLVDTLASLAGTE